MSVAKAKLKWKNIRDRYVKMKKDQQAKSKSGAGSVELPKWALYPILDSMLAATIEPRPTTTNVTVTPKVQLVEVDSESPEMDTANEQMANEGDAEETDVDIVETVEVGLPRNMSTPARKKRKESTPNVAGEMLERLASKFDTAHDVMHSLKTNVVPKTTTQMWLESMAPKIESLPDDDKDDFRFEVEQLLYTLRKKRR